MQSQPDADTYHAFMQNLVRSLRFLRDDVPLVVTNTDTPNIHDTLVGCLRNQYLDSVYFSAPYISEYFVNVLKQTPVKSVFVMVDKDPTDYVKKAMTELLNLRQSHRIEINVVQRPPKSSFLQIGRASCRERV